MSEGYDQLCERTITYCATAIAGIQQFNDDQRQWLYSQFSTQHREEFDLFLLGAGMNEYNNIFVIINEESCGVFLDIDNKVFAESRNNEGNSILLIFKSKGSINHESSVRSQLSILSLPDEIDASTLKFIINNGVNSILDMLVQSNVISCSAESFRITKSKLQDFYISLQNLRHSIPVPDLSASTHARVQEIITKGANTSNYLQFFSNNELSDSNFLNSLQSVANKWQKSLRALTDIQKDIIDGSASDEVHFWSNLQNSLISTTSQLQSPEVEITLSILTKTKRLRSISMYIADSGIMEKLQTVKSYNQFTSSIPLVQLYSSSDISGIVKAIELIAAAFKKFRFSDYLVSRFVVLVEKISEDVHDKLLEVSPNFFTVDYETFKANELVVVKVVSKWNDILQENNIQVREVVRRRSPEKVSTVKIKSSTLLEDTIKRLAAFRKQHSLLSDTLRMLDYEDFQSDLKFLYEPLSMLNNISFYDWTKAQSIYNQRLPTLESKIIQILQAALEHCKTSEETLNQFIKFMPLMAPYPMLRTMMKEHQQSLLSSVKQEIITLEKKLDSDDRVTDVLALKNLPSVSSVITECLQVRNRVNVLQKRIKLLLGSNWENSPNGSILFHKCASLLEKLNVDDFVSNWMDSVSEDNSNVMDAPILKILVDNSKNFELLVNFNFSCGLVFKEVRNLIYMGYNLPIHIVRIATRYRNMYPQAILLLEQVQTFLSLVREVANYTHTGVLLKNNMDAIWSLIGDAMSVSWTSCSFDDSNVLQYQKSINVIVQLEKGISVAVDNFQKLHYTENKLEDELNTLSNMSYDSQKFSERLINMQLIIEELRLLEIADLTSCIFVLNERIGKILTSKIQSLLEEMNFTRQTISITFEGDVMRFFPSINEIKMKWIQELENILISATNQYQLMDAGFRMEHSNFATLYSSLEERVLITLRNIGQICEKGDNYMMQWKKHETMWDLEEAALQESVGSSMDTCYHLLNDFLQLRPSLSELKNGSSPHPLLFFQCEDVFSVVCMRFDYWQKYLCNLLLSLYMHKASFFCNEIKKDTVTIEQTLDISSLQGVSDLTKAIERIKTNCASRCDELKLLAASQNLLYRLRFKLPSQFVYIDQIENDFNNLTECARKKEESLNKSRHLIITRLETEIQRVDNLSNSLVLNWTRKKPTSGEWRPIDALAAIASFEKSFESLNSDIHLISECARILLFPIVIKHHLREASTELQDYKAVWTDLEGVWNSNNVLMELEWNTLDIMKLRSQAAIILEKMENLAPKVRQYKIFDHLISSTQELLNSIEFLKEMKSPSIKVRHWSIIFKETCDTPISKILLESSAFSLRDVLSVNFKLNEKFLKEVIQKAQREYVLEQSLHKIKIFWKNAQYETFEHNGGITLVKDWNFLQQSCTDDLEELVSMKNSAYYKVFEQDCLELESKLTALSGLQQDWIEVQFFWLDLYGIIGKNKELQNFLPLETSKFRNLSLDLSAILSRIFQLASAIDAVHISESFTVFKRILASFKMIKTSLNDFLERQRKLFPRFYFLGNDDLLKLLGAGEDLTQVSNCLQKMYGTIAGLAIQGINVEGIYSVEGELLKLENFVQVSPLLKCHEWLSLLDIEIRNTISSNITACISSLREGNKFSDYVDIYIFQVLLVSWQVFWTSKVDECLEKKNYLNALADIDSELNSMLQELKNCKESLKRKKIRSLLVECIHFCDIITRLSEAGTPSEAKLIWNNTQRFHYRDEESDALKRIDVFQSGRSSTYGFAYIGIPERLIYTQNLQRGFSALTEALHQKFGGCFFGPAGTGKTETVKALGQNLGRMVLVFNCDDSYDFQAMTRILLGITQIGAWGCFDEFNRLDENILSAVSGHVEVIQNALYAEKEEVHIMRSSIPLHQHTALFITLNPGYTGRSELPENLKKKFREFSMKRSDNHVISEVILRILGFDDAKGLASKIVELFDTLESKCTPQKHYDFGLRILKKSLRNCQEIMKYSDGNATGESILVQSLSQMLQPTLNKIDEEVFLSAIKRIFSDNTPICFEDAFSSHLIRICKEKHMSASSEFLKKCHQFYHIQKSQQAIILTGSSGVGKTSVWKTTLKVLEDMDDIDNVVYTIDTKTLSKEELYGKMNRATLEWRDGVFTAIVRQVHDDPTGAFKNSRIWIIFDSDIDPEYTETLNSALDDNKLITLPTGERISIPTNLHLIFEAPNLDHATPATITRCGLLWFPQEVYLTYDYFTALLMNEFDKLEMQSKITLRVIKNVHSSLFALFSSLTFLKLVDNAKSLDHIMGFDLCRSASVLGRMIAYNLQKYERPLRTAASDTVKKFLYVKIYPILIYAFVGDTSLDEQVAFQEIVSDLLKSLRSSVMMENSPEDLELCKETLNVIELSSLVPKVTIEAHEVMKPNIIIPTLETIKHENLVFDLLNAGRAIILSGPPGSGKTMILNNALQNSSMFEVVGMNFSKDTTVAQILRTLKRHTIYIAGPKGLTLRPKISTKEIVLFCDEINLPKLDEYGSQSVILFLRQLIEKKGFWRAQDNKWITIEGIHFVGACNPATDPGRIPITRRFSRHVSILEIEYPRPPSLRDIYYIFFDATLRLTPEFRSYAGYFCEASIHLYDVCKSKFSTNTHVHYICSPRELTRWIRGFYTAIINGPQQTLQSLLRVWAYEAWRIFADRLTNEPEKDIFENILHETVLKYFPHEEMSVLSSSLLLFSPWLSLEYKEVSKTDLLDFIKQRFKTFCEEETEVYFIIYDEMLDHVLRIDRILKQIQGHGMLIGPSRTGKTTMTKFVAWLNGMTVLQPNIHRNYTIVEFDEFLRKLLVKCAIDEENFCLIIDESHILETSFLERMNTLLANSDIPDLFQGDQYDGLMAALKQRVLSLGLLIDGEQEIYNWFTQQISKNLHVIFTMCDSKNEVNSNIMTSPALFNRCVINWMGEWSIAIMSQVANKIIQPMPLELVYDESSITKKDPGPECKKLQDIIVSIFLQFHSKYCNEGSYTSRSPGIFLDALKSFERIFKKKSQDREDSQRFISNGLDKLNESVLKVKEMSKLLSVKQDQLRVKEREARRTLDTMLIEQNEAERKQETTVEIKRILGEREKDAAERRNLVMSDLKAFAPVMIEAQRGVKNIKKQQLTEIRSMINPPMAVKITMEAVCMILGHKTSSWRDIQLFIRKDEFIYEIVHFDTDTMLSIEMKSCIEASYLSRPDFTYETVNRASKACGPLYQWVYAQIKYGEILKKVRPLQEEIKNVEDEGLQSKARLLAAEDMIVELEASIEKLKQNYSSLIRDIELIKTEMQEVQHKMDRSRALVANLTTEKTRWSRSTALFKKSSEELAGNCLISALYSNYCGSLNEKHRKKTLNQLITTLRGFNIEFDPNYQFYIYTVEMEKRLKWMTNGVPNEEFYLENFVMIFSSHDIVPYIVDPNLEIVPILSRYYCGKLVVMSFLEQGFVKRLKNAIKFGGVVLIQDSEMFDPIICNLISHEYKRSGERQTVQIGENEIDISPQFSLLLHSNDPNATIPNYLKSRVRMINFTMNKGSIEMQAVRMALTQEAPEIQNERVELMKLNGEYKVMLKSLETRLLEGLNDSKGNILENDDLMITLERLKLESLEVEKKLKNTEYLMEKMSNFSDTYSLLGTHSAMLYSILEIFSELHWFYDIPMWQYKNCLMGIFKPDRHKSKEFSSRIEELLWVLYQDVYSIFSAYLVKRHKMELAIVLYMMYHFGFKGEGLKENVSFILDLMRGNEENHCSSEKVTDNYPAELGEVIKLLQGKSFIAAIRKFQAVFLRELKIEDLALLDGNTSFLMGTERNTDGSFKLIQIAKDQKRKLTIIALGSSESTDYAEQEISRSSSDGGWILLQNLQMSMSWTKSVLIKKVEQLAQMQRAESESFTSTDVKIFMTCNLFAERLPLPLLQQSYKSVYEDYPSILNTVKDLWYGTCLNYKVDHVVSLFTASKFLFTWFHAILVGRSRLAPIGFSKNYDFNDCDFKSGLTYLDDLTATIQQEKSPIIWEQICYSIGKIIYGGKVDDENDFNLVQRLCAQIFSPKTLGSPNEMKEPVELVSGVILPDQSVMNNEEALSGALEEIVEPVDSHCQWLGLPGKSIQEYEAIMANEIATQTWDIFQSYFVG